MKDHRESGFTLIEILIAVVILGLMMISVYSIINNSTQTKETILKEDSSLMQLQAALSRFELDYSSVTSPLFYASLKAQDPNAVDDFTEGNTNINLEPFTPSENFLGTTENGQIVPTFQMPDTQTLIFFSSSHHRRVENAKQSRYSWIRYHLRDNSREDESGEKIPGKELVRSSAPEDIYRPEIDWSKEKEFILLDNIKEFKWGFWDKDKENFVSTVRELTNPNSVPRLVQISLIWIAPDQTEVEITRTFRPLFPFFDTKAEADALKAKRAAQASGSSGGPNQESFPDEPPPPSPDEGEFGGDDEI